MMNYLTVVCDGERVATKVKGFINTIQNLTTDFLLKEFRVQAQYQDVTVGEDKPPEEKSIEDLNERTRQKIGEEFMKIQLQKEDHKKRLDPTLKNLNEYLKYKNRHAFNEKAVIMKQKKRADNITNYKHFVAEWQKQLALHFFNELQDDQMSHASEFYSRKDVMNNLRRRVLKNLDLAIESAIFEGELVLKKYDSLSFYLKHIAFGHINTFQAMNHLETINATQSPGLDEKINLKKASNTLRRIKNQGTIASGTIDDWMSQDLQLNLTGIKAHPDEVMINQSARQSHRMREDPNENYKRKGFDRPRDSYLENDQMSQLDW